MSEDKLKKYIDQHRAEFESDHPSAQVWNHLEKMLQAKVSQPSGIRYFLPRILKVAATVFVLLTAGGGIGYYIQSKSNTDLTQAIQNPDQRKEFKEASNYFNSQIDSKIVELQQYESSSSIVAELNQIDQVSAELKMEILKNPDQDQDILVQEMMLQYQLKLNVLNKILTKLKDHEPNQPSSTKSKLNHDTLRL